MHIVYIVSLCIVKSNADSQARAPSRTSPLTGSSGSCPHSTRSRCEGRLRCISSTSAEPYSVSSRCCHSSSASPDGGTREPGRRHPTPGARAPRPLPVTPSPEAQEAASKAEFPHATRNRGTRHLRRTRPPPRKQTVNRWHQHRDAALGADTSCCTVRKRPAIHWATPDRICGTRQGTERDLSGHHNASDRIRPSRLGCLTLFVMEEAGFMPDLTNRR